MNLQNKALSLPPEKIVQLSSQRSNTETDIQTQEYLSVFDKC